MASGFYLSWYGETTSDFYQQNMGMPYFTWVRTKYGAVSHTLRFCIKKPFMMKITHNYAIWETCPFWLVRYNLAANYYCRRSEESSIKVESGPSTVWIMERWSNWVWYYSTLFFWNLEPLFLCLLNSVMVNSRYPLIDANMRELSATGFMSNRGRQVSFHIWPHKQKRQQRA